MIKGLDLSLSLDLILGLRLRLGLGLKLGLGLGIGHGLGLCLSLCLGLDLGLSLGGGPGLILILGNLDKGEGKERRNTMRSMINTTNEEAKKASWKIIVPFPSEVVGKATYEDKNMRIMKSTKRFKVPGGWIYNTSTEHIAADCTASVAEALVFVPEK